MSTFTHKASITGGGSPNYLNGPYGVFVDGNYAYVTSRLDDALTVFDISDVANGNIVHQAEITGGGSPNYLDQPNNVFVSGNYAYVVTGADDSLTVFDISDVANGNISHVAEVHGAGSPNYLQSAQGIFVSGNYAYVVAYSDDALTVWDISDVANGNIAQVAETHTAFHPQYLNSPRAVYVSGDYAYVVTAFDYLTIFDISDAANGNITHKVAITGNGSPNYLHNCYDCYVSGDYCYVSSSDDNAITAFDISDVGNGNITHQAAITGAGSPNYLNAVRRIDIQDNYLFVVAYSDDALTVLDVSDIASGNITHEDSIDGSGSPEYLNGPYDVYYSNGYAYTVAYVDDSLSAFDFSINAVAKIKKTVHGKNAKVSYSAATLIKDGNSWSLSIDGGVVEVPEFGDEWNYRLVGLRDWTATIDLNLDMTSTQQATVQTWILGTTPSTATFRFYINATNYYEGVGWVGTEDIDVSVTDPESISFGVSGHGTLTYT